MTSRFEEITLRQASSEVIHRLAYQRSCGKLQREELEERRMNFELAIERRFKEESPGFFHFSCAWNTRDIISVGVSKRHSMAC